jgi:hypothetical protein
MTPARKTRRPGTWGRDGGNKFKNAIFAHLEIEQCDAITPFTFIARITGALASCAIVPVGPNNLARGALRTPSPADWAAAVGGSQLLRWCHE